jgi:GWxTD domain-containing protein
MRYKVTIWLGGLLLTMLISCGGVGKVQQTKTYDDFLAKTRLIMLKTEIEIYKHLPDEEAKDEFRKEFWAKRDPDPSTLENEAKEEFDKRIEYITRWFCEGVGKNRCLNSDRGKVYILLGQPDERNTERGNIIDRFGKYMKVLKEIWIYHDHRLYLEFIDREGLGEYRLRTWSIDLLRAIEMAKFTIYQDDQSRKYAFKFKADFKDNKLNIQIPVSGLNFKESGTQIEANFKIDIHIYFQYKKREVLNKTFDWTGSKPDLLKLKTIDYAIPYPLKTRGIYYLEIIITDLNSLSKYRQMIKKKV